MYRTKVLFIFILLFGGVIKILAQQVTINPDSKFVVDTTYVSTIDSIQEVLDNYENIKLPPLSVFLQSIYDHPSLQIYEARKEEESAILKGTKQQWLNYIRFASYYQYGQLAALSRTPESETNMYTLNNKSQSQYNIGINLSIPIGDLLGQKQKVHAQKARLRQLEYEYDMTLEERKLLILQAYNQVVEQLSTLKAKSDAAALYDAQMKITEQDFINGKIDIMTLSMERGRRSKAVVDYQEGRAALHNAITLLEMLTNVKVINK